MIIREFVSIVILGYRGMERTPAAEKRQAGAAHVAALCLALTKANGSVILQLAPIQKGENYCEKQHSSVASCVQSVRSHACPVIMGFPQVQPPKSGYSFFSHRSIHAGHCGRRPQILRRQPSWPAPMISFFGKALHTPLRAASTGGIT
jgi:hypothetical protein